MSKLESLKKKFRDFLNRNKEVRTTSDPWGKESEVLEESKSSFLKFPKIKMPERKIRIPGLAHIKLLISTFIFLNMAFLSLGMLINFYPSAQNQYLMWLFLLSAITSMDHILMKRKAIKQRKLEKVLFEERKKGSD